MEDIIPMSKKDVFEMAVNNASKETKEWANKVFYGKVKFYKGPVIGTPMFNVNILKEMNVEQLKFLEGFISEELKNKEG